MGLLCVIILAAALGAETHLEQPKAVTITMVAVQATNRPREQQAFRQPQKQFDAALEGVRSAIEHLPYDTFRKVGSGKAVARTAEETRMGINDRYAVCVTPLSKDAEGRIRLKVRIEERITKGSKTVTRNAIETTGALAPGKHLVLGGLKLDNGELVVVLSAESD